MDIKYSSLYSKVRLIQIKLVIVVLLLACSKKQQSSSLPVLTGTPEISITTLISNQGIIWGFDQLPNGNLLFTQKNGSMQLYDTIKHSTTMISNLPSNISAAGQGGLLDIAISQDYARSGIVFVTYSISGGFLSLAKFILNENTATASNWQVIKTTESASTWNGHFGSRISFGPDGKLYWSVGEGGNGSTGGVSSPHQNGQQLNTLWGKIHRLNIDGSVPNDNPLLPGQTIRNSIYSYGHRNPQGMAFEPITGRLYSNEHGPLGGCELNFIQAGSNYGWPHYSNGINYDGTNISNGHNATGIVAPLKSWTPALAPSGLTFINHPSFRDWNGNILMGSLGRQQLIMIKMTSGLPDSEVILLENYGRIRNVKMAKGGKIYVSVEDGGRLLELSAK